MRAFGVAAGDTDSRARAHLSRPPFAGKPAIAPNPSTQALGPHLMKRHLWTWLAALLPLAAAAEEPLVNGFAMPGRTALLTVDYAIR